MLVATVATGETGATLVETNRKGAQQEQGPPRGHNGAAGAVAPESKPEQTALPRRKGDTRKQNTSGAQLRGAPSPNTPTQATNYRRQGNATDDHKGTHKKPGAPLQEAQGQGGGHKGEDSIDR